MIQNWLTGWKVILRFSLFYIVLSITSSIASLPLIITLSSVTEGSKEPPELIMLPFFLIALLVTPYIFYFTSRVTGLLQDKMQREKVRASSGNKAKGEQLMKELKQRKMNKI